MKFLGIGAGFLFTFILAAGCIAEGMGSASQYLSFMMLADRVLTVGCFISCCLAIYKMLPAAIVIWIIVAIHGMLCIKYDAPGQLTGGVLRFAVAAAIFLTLGYWGEKRSLA